MVEYEAPRQETICFGRACRYYSYPCMQEAQTCAHTCQQVVLSGSWNGKQQRRVSGVVEPRVICMKKRSARLCQTEKHICQRYSTNTTTFEAGQRSTEWKGQGRSLKKHISAKKKKRNSYTFLQKNMVAFSWCLSWGAKTCYNAQCYQRDPKRTAEGGLLRVLG